MEEKKVSDEKVSAPEVKDICRIVICLNTEGKQSWKIENEVNNLVNFGVARDLAQWATNQIQDQLIHILIDNKIEKATNQKLNLSGFRPRKIMDILRGK